MKFFDEFKEFISKGNAMDMAVGVIIGGGFTAIVTSLTNDILNPFLKLLTPSEVGVSGLVVPVPGMEGGIDFSAFISAIVNFLIISFVVFCLVKAINSLQDAGKKAKDKVLGTNGEEEEAEPEPPTCPYCLEEIKEGATRCPHCAGDIAAVKAE